ncbi:MAG: GNAT family N-acetyltransferase [Bacteroidetes bacterium]|nr:GNAT family N-acetyltransferase [Bacteroidota bacterium]
MEIRLISPAEQGNALTTLLIESGLRVPDDFNRSIIWTGLSLNGQLIACAGIEMYDQAGLLRSVAVAGAYRGKGYGSTVVKAAAILARLRKLRALYLFTEEASGFFGKNGYELMERSDLPADIAASSQAAQECSKMAVAMYCTLPETLPHVLVLCTGNSCRSQMAHAYLNKYLGGRASVYSAGIETHGLNPGAVAILKEDGLDITLHTSNHVDEYAHLRFDLILTVCDHAKEHCPWIPGDALRIHHNFTDPSKVKGSPEEVQKAFLETREEISSYCRNLAAALGIPA